MQRAALEDRIRKAGFRATKPRVEFLALLSAHESPASVQELADKAHADMVTFYRIAESFEVAGLIQRVDLRTGSALYEIAGTHHHHVVCTDCGVVEDVDVCLPERLTRAVAEESKSFTNITSHALEFFGTCKKCTYA